MSELHVRQLETYFQNSVVPHIDVSDLAGKPTADIEKAKLSRALTAFALSGLSGISVLETANFVVDGERDQGIDGYLYDQGKNTLIFVQSKWHGGGTKTIGKGDILKFLHGVKLVLAANWTTFSSKFKSQKAIIEQVLLKPDVQIVVAVAFTGDNELGDECKECLRQFQNEQNTVEEFLETRSIDLRALHRYFRTATLAQQPAFTGMLLDWGQSTEPYSAVYGRICCEDLAKLYASVGEPLFEPNIRSFLGDGEVNNQIVSTLVSKPEEFWYLNNGVTAICTKFTKTALGGGDNRHAGTFVFHGIQVVNGAQTIGSIGKAFEKAPQKVSKAFAMIKIISLEGAPLGFTDVVTVSTNRQNKVEEKDFLALDQNQNRIKIELASKGIQYAFRSGESVVSKLGGFDVTEAIVALACSASDVGNAVLAKRNIGLLLDRKSVAYQSLLHSGIAGTAIWDRVQDLRKIEASLARNQAAAPDSKRKQIFTHGNRVLSWAAFNGAAKIDVPVELDLFILTAAETADSFIKANYPDAYLAVFFKNTQKCVELAKDIIAETS